MTDTRIIDRFVPIARTARVMQLEGMFDIAPAEKSGQTWTVSLPLDDRAWNIGLIVGPSGSGKTTVAREFFPDHYMPPMHWSENQAVVDAFPDSMSIKDVTILLSSVGFSSPPAWLRPFHALSTGEQFRCSIARTLAELPDLAVIDEFTSVVDRRVAQVGSAAVAKTVRRRGQKLVAVTCHYDVEEWLDPDWVYRPSDGQFLWRELRGRPKINLEIARVRSSIWRLFAPHHYLTADLNKSAVCFCGFIEGEPVAFQSYLSFVGKLRDSQHARRGHRSVTLPDFQGLGLGNALITECAAMWRGLGERVFRNTGHPAEIASAARSTHWHMIRPPGQTGTDRRNIKRANDRLTASFEYVGPAMERSIAAQLYGSGTAL